MINNETKHYSTQSSLLFIIYAHNHTYMYSNSYYSESWELNSIIKIIKQIMIMLINFTIIQVTQGTEININYVFATSTILFELEIFLY